MKRSRKKIRPQVRSYFGFVYTEAEDFPWKGWLPKHLRGKGHHRFKYRNRRYLAKRGAVSVVDWVLRDLYRDKSGRPPSMHGLFNW